MGSLIEVREGRPEDEPAVVELCREKPYFDSLLLSAPKLREFTVWHLEQNFARLDQLDNCRVLLAVVDGRTVGYAVLLLHTRETITQEAQTLLFDWAVPGYEVLAPLVERAIAITREVGDDYLVAHIPEASKKEQIWFYRLAFRPELNRVVKPIAAGHRGPESTRYRARAARGNEHMFIVRVNAEYAGFYRPAGRDTDLQIVKANFLGAYVALNLKDPSTHYIVLEDTAQARQLAGYIILIEHELPLGSGTAYYTYDVAVAPEYAGRGLSLYLCGAAESVVGRAGGGFLFGDTSLDNLAAVNGDRQLGFLVDSKRWGLDCRGLAD